MSQDKDAWIEHKVRSSISPESWETMTAEMRGAVRIAAESLYHWGMQHGRMYAGCGTEPYYHVEQLADVQAITPSNTSSDVLSGAA